MAALLTPFVYPYRDSWNKYPIYSADEVIKRAQWLCSQNPVYSQGTAEYSFIPRGMYMENHSFDCSSFIAAITGYSQAFHDAPSTTYMPENYENYGYKHVYKNVNYMPIDPSLFKKGDILIYAKKGTDGSFSSGHTALYMGDGLTTEMMGRASGAQFGVSGRMSYGWQDVLRNPKSGFYPIRAY